MGMLTNLRGRLEARGQQSDDTGDGGGKDAEAPVPFEGYDRLDETAVKQDLSDRSQVELEAVENYERSHKNRLAVLDKLRYMRGREPFPGYDELSTEEIVSGLAKADPATLKKIRSYERKFAHRPAITDEAARLLHERRHGTPAAG